MKDDILKIIPTIIFIGVSIFFIKNVYADENITSQRDFIFKQTEKTIIVNMHKSNLAYTTESILVTKNKRSYTNDFNMYKNKSYNGVVVSFLGNALGYFSADTVVITICNDSINSEGMLTGGCEDVPDGETSLRIPYFPNGKYADIYDPEGKKILTIDLSSKSTCNENNACDRPIEDSLNCPQDCKDGQPVIDALVAAPVQPPIVPQKTFWEKVKPFVIVAAAIVALVGCVALVFAHMRRKNGH